MDEDKIIKVSKNDENSLQEIISEKDLVLLRVFYLN